MAARSLCVLLLPFTAYFVLAQSNVKHILGAKRTTVIPETFLRAYDPITVFFAKAAGPAQGGPLDQPEPHLRIVPPHPGEYRWLDAKTLQFLPTTPWPALAQFTVTVEGREHGLITLMAPPSRIVPAPGSRDLEPLQEMTLSFNHRLNPHRLADMVSVEIKDLPGMDSGRGQWLSRRDFNIKELERTSLNDPVLYQLSFRQPIPYGKHVELHLRLSADPNLSGHLLRYVFGTKPLFRLQSVGAGKTVYPLSIKGGDFPPDQALNGGNGPSEVMLHFSNQPGEVSLAQVKRMVRFDPAVRHFRHEVSGKRLRLIFDADRGRAYRLTLSHTLIRDLSRRPLAPFGESSLYFFFPREPGYIRWRRSEGILERFGPQSFPVESRDETRVDLRIYKIDPLSRNFWPFPPRGLTVDENEPPAGPGEEPEYAVNIAEQIRQLGSPLISRIVPLPVENGRRANFGLDLGQALADISGEGAPGTYLAGIRPIGSSAVRHYIRLQVTDLSLSTVEEETGVTFLVTSLRSGEPVGGARIWVDGFDRHSEPKEPVTLISGTTDIRGMFRHAHLRQLKPRIYRIAVQKDTDTLVLNPRFPPAEFYDNHWYGSRRTWLGWLNNRPVSAKNQPSRRAHLFSERPVYRPEDPVHIKGYLRLRQAGDLVLEAARSRSLVIEGPGKLRWTYPVTLNAHGGFYRLFDEKDLPTGRYRAWLLDDQTNQALGAFSFQKESYRIPRFEVRLSGPQRVPSDRPFQLDLTTDYYAGGRVVDHEVIWEITRYPYRITATNFPGYLFSSDERFGESGALPNETGDVRRARTDENGSARLSLDPAKETQGRPLRYVVEATIRGADEQTVSTTHSVLALPPFVLGLKLERFLQDSMTLRPEILVLNHLGKPEAGHELKLRLLHRQWHSYLRESDFTTGKAQYVTDVVDEPVWEQVLVSEPGPLTWSRTVTEAGVYVVELSARDRLGRLQKVSADLFVSGTTAVAWPKPKSPIFETAWDKTAYNPGETASLLLKSPFQKAFALIVVEAPDANRYHWVPIKNGQGLFQLAATTAMAPKLPVHALLLRGRLDRKQKAPNDLARPTSLAATAWLSVHPSDFKINLRLNHPPKSLPGAQLPLTLKLTDPDGRPLNGEVALWLVDRAVLALGKEQSLDPLPAFMEDHRAWIRIRDARNEVIGELPYEPFPGGAGEEKEASLFGKLTVRKNFQAVPYFNPEIGVVNGEARVVIDLSDDLTDFAVRAVATDGKRRFGFAKSTVSVRLPVIVQSALPRFVRPGDQFNAGGIGRVVEGEAGPGSAEIKVEGVRLEGEDRRVFDWVKDQPQRLFFPMTVITPASSGDDVEKQITIHLAVKRDSDGAGDAFKVALPVKPDRDWEFREQFSTLSADAPVPLLEPERPPRPGTLTRSVLLTHEPALLKMLAGLQYLDRYPHGCTEQRVSKLIPDLALEEILSRTDRTGPNLAQDLEETLAFLEKVQQPDGLFSYWPGSTGYVSLTAYVVEFLSLVRDRGHSFNPSLLEKAVNALNQALRSDYSRFIAGSRFLERAEALAALATAGTFDEAYAFELAARAGGMNLYSEAKILRTLLTRPQIPVQAEQLAQDLWRSVVFAMRDGVETFQGLQYRAESWGGLILSSETKTLAGITRALYRREPQNPRVRLLLNELVSLGRGDGWGSTHANAAALLAIGEVLAAPTEQPGQRFALRLGPSENILNTGGRLITRSETGGSGTGHLAFIDGENTAMPLAWQRMRYVPEQAGDQVKARQNGFVVEREWLLFHKDGTPPTRHRVEAGTSLAVDMGTLIEEHVRVVNPEDRYFVAIQVPLAAGMEPLNPNLATAPKEALPRGSLSLPPSYALFGDDQVTFYYDRLAKGTYDFFFRLRASIAGSFTQPAARAELMYRQEVFGRGNGMRIIVRPRPEGPR